MARCTPPALALAAVLAVVAALLGGAQARHFTRCGLVHELRRQAFPTDKLRDWVCLVESESGRETSIKSRQNKDGSYDYGLFQINSRYWCGIGKVGGDCKMKCEDLLNDDISDDSRCAKKIYARHKFLAWNGWKSKCRDKRLPDISKC
ncbi:hypothetical protein R5R35_009359 [Gryllus longicercus]|uniref:lysozyme n=1 Tax=Gryllus longicercus TaxID=2509291 RepID=A0AAN9VGU5_9ORTH